ncbi:SUKH-3 domain-containing protein [Solwaraspora sp. WMMD406]|uniref:SUKH-3 domain-containing protein n=1 Tax=Solwaraspora sp. WMMD406 TaxID=3016095 RepID=UPI0024164C2D|nr:SUKH-3 domain-containing protein [Solwaraspora sp. WMMD406]MDG4762751.1 SUKH-3 domain-containing protein [Solwaraspora sp. WMMD406]
MISRAEALARARRWAAQDRPGAEPEVGLHEFDDGYVAWRVEPVPPDPQVPVATGQPRVVIDRQTGELSVWPSLPAPVIAARYRAEHDARQAAVGRFAPEVRHVLQQAGWFPGRDVSASVDRWLASFADELAGLSVFPAARSAMVEFGGLTVPQFGLHGEPGGGFTSYLHPTGGGVVTDAARVFAEEYDDPVFPIGNHADGPSELVMDAQGRVFLLHWAEEFFVAAGIDAALTALIRGDDLVAASERTW